MKAFLETWRDIEGYEGLYQVSDFGDVRRLSGKGCKETRILKSKKDGYGYLFVGLCKESKVKPHKIHRLVAQAFIPNPENLPCINHKDEDKTSNVVTNLEWCSIAYNNSYGTRNQRIAEVMTNGKQSKKLIQLTLDYVFVKEWASTRECERNGFSHGNVAACCNNKYGLQGNVYKGYRWMYAEDYYKNIAANAS